MSSRRYDGRHRRCEAFLMPDTTVPTTIVQALNQGAGQQCVRIVHEDQDHDFNPRERSESEADRGSVHAL